MKLLPLLCCLWLSACASLVPQAKQAGELFAYIKVTEGAFSGKKERDTGYFFYVESPPGVEGPMLKGYEFLDGRKKNSFGGGSNSARVIAAINAVGLEPFDFREEIKEVSSRLSREAEQRGERFFGPMVADGAEYEIMVVTPSGRFTLREWNPGYTIDFYAPHSAKIGKLKAIIDLLAQYRGRLAFGI